MAKKTIKKSEIKRLVESTLNELDWKTYMNAAKKSSERAKDMDDEEGWDETNRSERFLDAARDAYKRKYDGFDWHDGVRTDNYDGTEYDENDEPLRWPTTETDFEFDQEYGEPSVGAATGWRYDGDVYDIMRGDKYPYQDKFAGRGESDEDDMDSFRDVDDYMTDKSKYEKGKGWTNESYKRFVKQVTENVIRNLKKK